LRTSPARQATHGGRKARSGDQGPVGGQLPENGNRREPLAVPPRQDVPMTMLFPHHPWDAHSCLPPPMPGPALLWQAWVDVVFVHWRVGPSSVAHLPAAGRRPASLAGATYVGLGAFRVPRIPLLSSLPVGAFDEVSVRRYSVDEHGRRGVVFLTMDTDSAPMVATARSLSG